MFTFLAINELDLTASPETAWTFLSELYGTNTLDYEKLENWLREHTQKTE